MGENENTEQVPERERGWCRRCGRAELSHPEYPPDYLMCPNCGEEMKPLGSLTREERGSLSLQDWSEEVHKAGKWGPSPGGAAAALKCDRSMIDRLVDRGILEKSVYQRDGHHIVMISQRSIKQAKENKEKRGKWTDSGEDE